MHAARETRTGRAKGKHPKPPDETPRADEQSNLSDPDLRKSKQHEYRQAYNAQAVVWAPGSPAMRPGGHRGDPGRSWLIGGVSNQSAISSSSTLVAIHPAVLAIPGYMSVYRHAVPAL